jgi:hypothetical protein
MRSPLSVLNSARSSPRAEALKASVGDAGRRAKRGLGEARVEAMALGRETGARSAAGARMLAGEARKRPVSTGLLLLGAAAGGALLLNPALRRLAIANAPLALKAVRKHLRAAQPAGRTEPPFPPAELVSRRAGG